MVLSQVLLLLFKECFSFKVLQGSPIHRKNSKEIFVNLKSFTWNMIKLLDVNLNTKWKKRISKWPQGIFNNQFNVNDVV